MLLQDSSFQDVKDKELLQVTVRHNVRAGHVTLPVDFDGFNDVFTKHHYRQCGEYPVVCSRFEDLLWPADRPLPYPAWGSIQTRLRIVNINQFEELILALTDCVQDQLKTHNYNTVGNFLT